MANRHKHLNPNQTYEPKRCWVGETHKIIYDTLEEAELKPILQDAKLPTTAKLH